MSSNHTESRWLKIPGLRLTLPSRTPFGPEADLKLALYEQAVNVRADAGAEVNRRDAGRRGAKLKATEAAAEALVEGENPPDPEEVMEAYDRETAKRREMLGPLDSVRSRRADEFLDFVNEHKEEYKAQLAELIRTEPPELTPEGVRTLELRLSWLAYLQRFPQKCHVLIPTTLPVGMYGQHFKAQEVFSALQEAIDQAVSDVAKEAEEAEAEEAQSEEVTA